MRRPFSLTGPIAAFLVVLGSISAFADWISRGSSSTTRASPFGAASGQFGVYLGQYKQMYAATPFRRPISIGEIAFQTLGPPRFNPPPTWSDTFTLSLGTTAASPASRGTKFLASSTPDLKPVFSGTVTVMSPGSSPFDFFVPLSTPFLYDPAAGNLLLDVVVTAVAEGITPFAAGFSPDTARIFLDLIHRVPTSDGTGLLTRFADTPVAPTPEPSTIALIGFGLTLAGGIWRRRWASRHAGPFATTNV